MEDGSEQDVCKLAFELTDGLSLLHLRCFLVGQHVTSIYKVVAVCDE